MFLALRVKTLEAKLMFFSASFTLDPTLAYFSLCRIRPISAKQTKVHHTTDSTGIGSNTTDLDADFADVVCNSLHSLKNYVLEFFHVGSGRTNWTFTFTDLLDRTLPTSNIDQIIFCFGRTRRSAHKFRPSLKERCWELKVKSVEISIESGPIKPLHSSVGRNGHCSAIIGSMGNWAQYVPSLNLVSTKNLKKKTLLRNLLFCELRQNLQKGSIIFISFISNRKTTYYA